MAVQANEIHLPVVSQKELKKGPATLKVDVLHVAQEDARAVLKQITALEVADQQRLGNKPTNMVIDGKQNKSITDIQYKALVLFTDVASLIAGFQDAWRELISMGAKSSGYTVSQFQVWASAGAYAKPRFLANDPTGLSEEQLLRIGDRPVLYAVGPFVPWGRKYRWATKGGAPVKTRKGAKPKEPAPLQERVIRRVKPRWKGRVQFWEAWVKVPAVYTGRKKASTVDRLPSVTAGLPSRGRLNG